MIAYTEADALGLVETFRGLARRTVVISSADVYRAYGRFLGLEPGPIEPTPLTEEAPLRTALFPYRKQAQGPDDFFHDYDKIPVERAVLGDARPARHGAAGCRWSTAPATPTAASHPTSSGWTIGDRQSCSMRAWPAGNAHGVTSRTWRRPSPWRSWTSGRRAGCYNVAEPDRLHRSRVGPQDRRGRRLAGRGRDRAGRSHPAALPHRAGPRHGLGPHPAGVGVRRGRHAGRGPGADGRLGAGQSGRSVPGDRAPGLRAEDALLAEIGIG